MHCDCADPGAIAYQDLCALEGLVNAHATVGAVLSGCEADLRRWIVMALLISLAYPMRRNAVICHAAVSRPTPSIASSGRCHCPFVGG